MRPRLEVAVFALTAFLPASVGAQVADASSGATTAPAADTGTAKSDYALISLEELLNKDVSVAVTKTRVDVSKAPASVTVLTADDIRRSGALNLGELLRTVPGLDVLEAFPGYISVSARGTSESFVNNMLVLIDGRRFEVQLAGVPFLDEMPIRMEDIKRVEVVKGPVGAIYGTNALAGVISITTYGASELPGTMVSVTGGNRNTLDTTFRQSGRFGEGPWSYKFVAGYSYTGTWGSLDSGYALPPIGLRKGAATLLLERRVGNGRFEFEGGFSKGDLASLTIVTNQTQYFTQPHARIGYSQSDFHVLLTSSPQALELRERVPPIQPLTDRWSSATNLSLDRTFRPAQSSTITVGGNLRHQLTNASNLGGVSHKQLVGGVFVQDEQTLIADHLTVFGAIGVSHHPEIPTQVDGNIAVIATPVTDHTFRLSFGRAHRDPSFGENFLNFRRRFGPADGYQQPNLDLAPESIQSYEAGYHGRVHVGSARLELFAQGFKERLNDLIGIVTSVVPRGTLPDYPTATVLQQFRNLETRDGKGFEAGADLASASAHLAVQYSFQSFKNRQTGVDILTDTPRHKFSSGAGLSKGHLELDVWVHSVSKTVDITKTELKGYVLVNPRLGVRLGNWGLSVEAYNALNQRHVETANGRGIKGEEVGRFIGGNISYRTR
jgi:iron complex outermembrane receptor protein